MAGINNEGSTRYDQLLVMAKEGRRNENRKALEKVVLKKLREKMGITAATSWDEHNKSKRRVKAKVAHTTTRDLALDFEEDDVEENEETINLADLDASDEVVFV